MPLTEKTERALEDCYDAILAPTRWPSALQSLADLWERNQPHAPDPHPGPYLQKCTSFIRAGYATAVEHQVSTEEERKTLPYFQETARPARMEWWAVAFFSIEGRDWCVPFYRGDDRGPFDQEEARRLAGLGPHAAKVVSLAEKFAAFDVASKLSAMERVRCAALVVDATGRASQMNGPAQDLLGDDFNLVRGRPAARDPASNRRLQQLVSFALHAERGSAQPHTSIVVDRDEALASG